MKKLEKKRTVILGAIACIIFFGIVITATTLTSMADTPQKNNISPSKKSSRLDAKKQKLLAALNTDTTEDSGVKNNTIDEKLLSNENTASEGYNLNLAGSSNSTNTFSNPNSSSADINSTGNDYSYTGTDDSSYSKNDDDSSEDYNSSSSGTSSNSDNTLNSSSKDSLSSSSDNSNVDVMTNDDPDGENADGSELEIATDSSLPDANVGSKYSFSFDFRGNQTPLTASIVYGSLPSGITFDGNSTVSGTPTEKGESGFTISLLDNSGETVQKDFTLKVLKEELAINTDKELTAATPRKSYNITLKASGGTEPYSWSLVSGKMPKDLSLSSDGKISGTATETGTHQINIQVTDSGGDTIKKTFNLKIKTTDTAPFNSFYSAGSDTKVGLGWDLNNSYNFEYVIIKSSTSDYPTSLDEGATVYEGKASKTDNIVDDGLKNGTTYYYTIFAYDSKGTVSKGQAQDCTPHAVQLLNQKTGYIPFATEVVDFSPLSTGGFGASNMPDVALGPPVGAGTASGGYNVVSLHGKVNDGSGGSYGGSITVKFGGCIVVNGSGDDFTVFENVFNVNNSNMRWMEPGIVSVSQDGKNFYTFPFKYVTTDENLTKSTQNPTSYQYGFAGLTSVISNGISPDPTDPSVSGGDSFDLSSIKDKKLTWIRYIKVQSTGDNWLVGDNGEVVRHNTSCGACSGAGSAGFDFDAVAAIHY